MSAKILEYKPKTFKPGSSRRKMEAQANQIKKGAADIEKNTKNLLDKATALLKAAKRKNKEGKK